VFEIVNGAVTVEGWAAVPVGLLIAAFSAWLARGLRRSAQKPAWDRDWMSPPMANGIAAMLSIVAALAVVSSIVTAVRLTL